MASENHGDVLRLSDEYDESEDDYHTEEEEKDDEEYEAPRADLSIEMYVSSDEDDDTSYAEFWRINNLLNDEGERGEDGGFGAYAKKMKEIYLATLFGAKKLQGDTLKLFEACYDGDVRVVRRLTRPRWRLGRGVDVNTAIRGVTPLMVAVRRDRILVAAYLLHVQANANFADNDGRTALAFATSGEMANLLLSNGANDPAAWKKNMEDAARSGDIDLASGLLYPSFGVDTPIGDHGESALLLACEENNSDLVEFLLTKAGANINFTDERGRTCLHAARTTDMIRLLVQKGADIDTVDMYGKTRLHLAWNARDFGFVRELLKAGARDNIADQNGDQILHLALESVVQKPPTRMFKRIVRVIQDLVERGATWDFRCDANMRARQNTAYWSREVERIAPAIRFAVLLWMDEYILGIPFTNIPQDDLERGLKAAQTYVTAHKASKTIVCRRTICLVGPSTAGKTSLIKSFINEQVCLEPIEIRTVGIDQAKFEFKEHSQALAAVPRSHATTFSDFAGQDAYQVMHSLFFTRHTLFLVCVDLEAYSIALLKCEMLTPDDRQLQHLMNEYVDRYVLHWIRIIFARQPDAEFVFVCTKEDAISSGPGVDKVEVVQHVRKMLGRVMVIVEDMRREYESNGDDVSEAASAHRVTHLWDPSFAKCEVPYVEMIVTSSTNISSVQYARREIVRLIVASSSSYEMPEKYTLVLNALMMRKLAAANKSRVLRIENLFVELPELITKLQRSVRVLDDDTAVEILGSLRDRGDILWYEDVDDEKLKRTVMIDPRLLIDFLREVVNHKHANGSLTHERISSAPCWIDLNDDAETMLAMKRLLQKFHLVHPACGEMVVDSDLIVPAYWKTNRHALWIFGGDDLRLSSRGTEDEAVSHRVMWEFRFAHYIPDTLFDNLIVATYSATMPMQVGPDYIWYQNADQAACRLIVSRSMKTRLRSLRLEGVLAAEPSSPTHARVLWFVFKRLCTALAAVLKEHKGLVVTSCARTDDKEYSPSLGSLLKSKQIMIEEGELGLVWMPPGTVAFECLELLVGN